MKPTALLFSLLAFAGTTQAAVTFTLTGTITQASGTAFTLGEAFTLSFTTDDTLESPNFLNDATGVHWVEANPADPRIWSDVSFGGATGSYVWAGAGFASADLQSDSDRPLYLHASNSGTSAGLGIVRGGEEVCFVEAWVAPSTSFASYGGTMAVRPGNTFVNGTYSVSTPVEAYFATDDYDHEYYATFSSLTISGSSIPEPSAAAIVAGLGALAAISLRRRRGDRASTRSAS